jgi:hypothetical protein
MDSNIVLTLKPIKVPGSQEQIKIRPRVNGQGFIVSYDKDGISWIADQMYPRAIAYVSDFLNLIPLSNLHLHHALEILIPGFPEIQFSVRDLDEKTMNSIIARMAEYMVNRWTPFKN